MTNPAKKGERIEDKINDPEEANGPEVDKLATSGSSLPPSEPTPGKDASSGENDEEKFVKDHGEPVEDKKDMDGKDAAATEIDNVLPLVPRYDPNVSDQLGRDEIVSDLSNAYKDVPETIL